jgi:probable F420-dependent oxidoreductase
MKVGIFTPLVSPMATPTYIRTLGTLAEDRGFHSLWFGEHIVLPENMLSAYPYSEDGRMPEVCGTRGFPELFTTLAFLAGCTTRIRLGSGTCILPVRNPVLTAKEAANIDWLSGGRFDLGLGLGWIREEYDAMGIPWEQRGRRADSYLELITALWRDDVTSFTSPFYDLAPCRLDPKPIQAGGVPIYVGGDHIRTFQRIAKHGDGWYAFALTPDQIAERLGMINH